MRRAVTALTAIDILPPPPPTRHPAPAHDRQQGGAPSAARAPRHVVTPPVRLPLPVVTPAPPAGGLASRGAGAGLAGQGAGTGSGDAAGDGGGSDAEWIKGAITDSDYPHEAREARQQGVTHTRVEVDANGRPSACTIRRSSGSALLDQTTCRLILKRFRFAPARDATGRAIADAVDYDQEWSITGYMGE
ncbi:MAG: TonB family protein [Sphingomonadales bacterium]|nr:TonB family protein [Sphingomonadales bacterium]